MITDLDLILADLQANWLLYLSMPFVAAAIGYGTKVVAIKMMFKPLTFVGWRPFWDGKALCRVKPPPWPVSLAI